MKFRITVRRYRDAVLGRFVTKQYADEHPNTTVAETQTDFVVDEESK